MDIIFIDFTVNMNTKNKNPSSFYSISLKEQYENIKNRMPKNVEIIDKLEDFIKEFFPSRIRRKYYFTSPNFFREKRKYDRVSYLDNVVIRPEMTDIMKRYLPENTNVILFGNICERNYLKSFEVTGIELIDSSISSKTDIVTDDVFCVHAFRKKNRNGREEYVWSKNHQDYNDSIFTPNFTKRLIEESFPLSNENLVNFFNFYDKWNEFIEFRLNYLNQQSSRNFEIDSVRFIEGYSINRKVYSANKDDYEEFLLVDHPEFKKGEQILLNYEVLKSEPFNLIEVNVDFNKKEFDSKRTLTKGKHKINPIEPQLKSLTRESVALSETKPTTKTYEDLLYNAYSLDDRYKIISLDIEPDTRGIVKRYKTKLKKNQNNITLKYNKIVKEELNKFKEEKSNQFKSEMQEKIDDFNLEFYNKLDELVSLNQDEDIIKKVNKQIKDKEKELTKKHKKDKKKKEDTSINIEEELNTFISQIDVHSLYIEKHEKEKEELIKKLNKEDEKKVKDLLIQKQKELEVFYNRKKEEEINKDILLNEQFKQQEIKSKIENETIKRFSIYFKVEQERINKQKLKKQLSTYKFLIYNNRAEKAKIERQSQSLKNFYSGNVKNPYLATYLFGADELVNENKTSDLTSFDWHLEYLNDKQKEAVYKAVTSNGIFLLQGPPGTGKTQVIAEIVSQYIQRGKKVVIASETHKAIDNVFERLPYLADIRPLRLIPDSSTKDSEYRPENLVDNFYNNISKKMQKVIKDYDKFNDYKENFKDNLTSLKMLNDKILREQKQVLKIQKELNTLSTKDNHIRTLINNNKEEINNQLLNISIERRTYRNLENSKLIITEDVNPIVLNEYLTEVYSYLKNDDNLIHDDINNLIKEILNINSEIINNEIRQIIVQKDDFAVRQREIEIRRLLDELKDELENFKEGTDEVRIPLQEELKEIINNKRNKTDFSHLRITKIIDLQKIKNYQQINEHLLTHKEKIIGIRNKYFNIINENILKFEEAKNNIERELVKNESDRSEVTKQISLLYNDTSYQSIKNDEARLRMNISKFIEDFSVSIKYNTYSEAIIEIEKAYEDLEKNFKKKEKQNKQIIPMFNKISKYLDNEEVIIADRDIYTSLLFDKVNLFGITTTSRDKFTQRTMGDLEQYNLDEIDLKEQGIDVVIIDEVSKSNFLDLLTPILYGKTVILVGDHRQLPPMYDLRNLRHEDFENISEDVLTEEKNKEYTTLFETSFFKTLFETIPSDYKVMLDRQYRSHEHIMEVYNCFYNHDLKIGHDGQNAEKQHHLTIISNNREIITPEKHVYFVDCKEFEDRDTNSTSIHNVNEADVVIKLLELINKGYNNNKNYQPSEEEKMSIGVITTYGDQARIINRRYRQARLNLNSFNKSPDSRLIISTVDDFQGDERDIIILSMVRNPENRARSNPGFINAFERVNVALSRARRLLIVVGNRSYLEDKGVVYLPDVYGDIDNDQPYFSIYKEVIGAINRYGGIFDDEDVLGGKK